MAAAGKKSLVMVTASNTQPLSTLIPDQENVTITVRVIRKWEVYLPKGGDKPVALELVLVDKQGTKIMLHIDMAYIRKHGSLLHEGSVVNLSRFGVKLAHGEYRPTRHQCQLNLRFHSVIQSVPTTEVELPPYDFTPPEELFDKEFNKNYLVDVVGVFTGKGTKLSSSQTGGQAPG